MNNPELAEEIAQKSAFIGRIKTEVAKVVIGQTEMVDRLLIGLITGGHVLLEGVPGLAKTLTIKTLSDTIDLDFQRIQFTPDLLPADLIGTMIYNPKTQDFEVRKGPVFSNLILADEINRAPAKVQSALLEAMQEKQVTLGSTTFTLPRPFFVLATQNPIEQEGTYRLPEAQVDRFMFLIRVGYPTRAEERQIMDRVADFSELPEVHAVASAQDLIGAQKVVRKIILDEKLREYIVDIISATRDPEGSGLSSIKDYIEFGASPRATINLNLAARAHAFSLGRHFVMPEDIKAVAPDILRHRVILSFEAEAEDYTPEMIIEEMLEAIEVP